MRLASSMQYPAAHTKNTYPPALYRRLAARRGKKRAIVAVAHAQLHVICHLLDQRCRYQDLGANAFDPLDSQRKARYHVKRLESLGYDVKIDPTAA